MVKLIVKVKLLPIDLKSRIFPLERDSTTAHQRLLNKSIVKVKRFSRPRMFTNFHVDWKIFKHRRRTDRHDKSNRELLRLVDVYDTETEKHFLPDNERRKHQKLGDGNTFQLLQRWTTSGGCRMSSISLRSDWVVARDQRETIFGSPWTHFLHEIKNKIMLMWKHFLIDWHLNRIYQKFCEKIMMKNG